jgi:hypothetical protein
MAVSADVDIKEETSSPPKAISSSVVFESSLVLFAHEGGDAVVAAALDEHAALLQGLGPVRRPTRNLTLS